MTSTKEELRQLAESDPNHVERKVCICCNRRVARLGDVFCSRCSVRKLQTKLQNKLPDGSLPVEPEPRPPSDVHLDQVADLPSDPNQATYNRREVGRLVGISPTTIMRWERKGYVSPPKRYLHSQQCYYTQEQIDEIRAFMVKEYQAPVVHSQPAQNESSTLQVGKLAKRPISSKLEKTVAKSLSGMSLRNVGKLI